MSRDLTYLTHLTTTPFNKIYYCQLPSVVSGAQAAYPLKLVFQHQAPLLQGVEIMLCSILPSRLVYRWCFGQPHPTRVILTHPSAILKFIFPTGLKIFPFSPSHPKRRKISLLKAQSILLLEKLLKRFNSVLSF
jgi:hypothetical protein